MKLIHIMDLVLEHDQKFKNFLLMNSLNSIKANDTNRKFENI
jgi:hypothetical protein